MKCRFIRSTGRVGGDKFEVGDVFEHPNAYQLVKLGYAEPADDECRNSIPETFTPEVAAHVRHCSERAEAGIAVEENPFYDAGYMTGYTKPGEGVGPNGDWIEGPNYMKYEQQLQDEEEEDDE